jgi:uncharacterized membrane protein
MRSVLGRMRSMRTPPLRQRRRPVWLDDRRRLVCGTPVHELHPMAVHLPIGLVLVYPWLELAAAVSRRKSVWVVALSLLGVAVLGSMFASATGEAAYEHAESLGFSHALLETHEEWSEMVPWLLLGVLGLRLWAAFKVAWGPWLGFGLGLAATGFIVQVGLTGGNLTYGHGVGVEGVVPSAESPES